MKNNKGFAPIALVLIIIAVLVIGGIAYYSGKSPNTLPTNNVGESNLPQVNQNTVTNTPPVNNQVDNTANNNARTTITTTTITTTACLPTTAPWIKVSSPKSGDTYTVGQETAIKWTSCNVANVYLGLINGGHDFGFLSESSVPASQDSYQWSIPNKTGSNYQIVIDNNSSAPEVQGRSGTFTIDNANNISTINSKASVSGNDVNGKQIGYIKSVSSSDGNYSLKIDYIQWVSPCVANSETSYCMNGYEIVNTNPLIRTFPISNNATIKMQTFSHNASGNFNSNQVVSLPLFEGIINGTVIPNYLDPSQNPGAGLNPYTPIYNTGSTTNKGIPFWITLNNGVITDITEQYIP